MGDVRYDASHICNRTVITHHTVVHNHVPVLSRHNSEQRNQSILRRSKVGVPIECLAVFDGAKQNDTSVSIEEHEQEHGDDDEEGTEDGHDDRQHEHLQCRLHHTCGALMCSSVRHSRIDHIW